MSAEADLPDFVLLASGVLVFSILYWSHPSHGARRRCDVAMATVSLSYSLGRSFELASAGDRLAYWAVLFAGVGCYLAARRSPCPDISSLCHAGLHLCGNVSNVVLYRGLTGQDLRLSVSVGAVLSVALSFTCYHLTEPRRPTRSTAQR